jgi:hypothetical protein
MITRTIHPYAAEASTTQSGSLTTSGETVRVAVDVTAITGTLDVSVEWSVDGTTFAAASPADTLTQFTAAGVEFGQFAAKAPYHRLVYNIVTGPATFGAVTMQ